MMDGQYGLYPPRILKAHLHLLRASVLMLIAGSLNYSITYWYKVFLCDFDVRVKNFAVILEAGSMVSQMIKWKLFKFNVR